MDPAPTPPLGAGALVSRSFGLLFRHFGVLFPLALAPGLALAALNQALLPVAPPDAAPAGLTAVGGLGALVNVLVGFVWAGVMCLAALDALLGKRHTLGQYLGQTLRHAAPVVALGVLLSLAVGLGLVLLIVPGLYLFARFLPLTPAVVFENAGWSGLGRAQGLTEGHRWPLVGASLLLGLALLVPAVVLSPIFLAPSTPWLAALLAEGVFSGLYVALIAVFTALVYLRLREIKEGASQAEIAAAID